MGKKSGPRKAADAQVKSARLAIDEQRRQFDYVSDLIKPFINQGMAFQQDISEGASIDGLDSRLGKIFDTEVFENLNSERLDNVNSSLSQSGLARSGRALREAAKVPTDTALAIENSIFGRQSNLFSNAQNAAARQGANATNTANNISSLLNQQGQATAAGILQGQQATAQQNAQIASALIGLMSFSDPRLKVNMQPVGRICDLSLYEWDWTEEAPEWIKHMTIGYNAEEVREKYPQYVSEVGGYLAINYVDLNAHLDQRLNSYHMEAA